MGYANRSERSFSPNLKFSLHSWVSEVTVISAAVHCLREELELGEYNPTHYAYSREKIWAQR